MNQRCKEITYMLLAANTPLSIAEIRQRFGVTARSIRYDLTAINGMLASRDLPLLQRNPAGIRLTAGQEQRAQLLAWLEHSASASTHQHSLHERLRYIELTLLMAEGFTTIEELSAKLKVSRSTIVNDLNQLKAARPGKLRPRGYPRRGLKMEGPEAVLRARLVELLFELAPVEDTVDLLFRGDKRACQALPILRSFEYFSLNDLKRCAALALDLESRLAVVWSDASILLITYALLACRLRNAGAHPTAPEMEDYTIRTRDFALLSERLRQLAGDRPVEFSLHDTAFITRYVLCAETENISYFKKENQIRIQLCAAKILRALGEALHVELESRDGLQDKLSEFLSHSYYRILYNFSPPLDPISHNDSWFKKIQKALPACLQSFEEFTGQRTPKAECDAIALLFYEAYALEHSSQAASYKTVVVPGPGQAARGLYLSALAANFPQIDVVAVLSRHHIHNYNLTDNLDFIITAHPLNLPGVREFSINNMGDPRQTGKLREFLSSTPPLYKSGATGTRLLLQNVLKAAGTVCSRAVYDRFITELSARIGPVEYNYYQGESPLMLKDILPPEHIRLDVEAADWEAAVRAGGQILVDNSCVESGFVDAMIELVKENGPYIVMAPGIALPHARPEDGVINMAMSLIRLKNPVNFGHEDNDPVQIVISLAAVDNSSHLEALSELFELIGNDELREVFFSADTPQAITHIFK